MNEFTGNDRFLILNRLGAGGMGVVYQAYDHEHGRVVALKTLKNVDPGGIYRIKREFRTLADVVHPNLATLYEFFSQEDQWFFTMEFVSGVDFLTYVGAVSAQTDPPALLGEDGGSARNAASEGLSEVEKTDPPPPPGETRSALFPIVPPSPVLPANAIDLPTASLSPFQIGRLRAALRQIAAGLEALHLAGKLHRDIKPSNVLVTREGRVVILDFGLAVEMERKDASITAQFSIIGTIPYMSPEQASSIPLTPASDWYSVGVMLYQALTRRLPFTGNDIQILTAKLQTDPPAPRQIVPDIPEDLHTLCVRLLSRDVSTRPGGPEILQILASRPDESPACPQPQTPPPVPKVFVGRKEQLHDLMDAFLAVRAGRTTVVRVMGKSGSGKTALVQHFLDVLRATGDAVILSGRCYERESVPYKAMDNLVDALSHYLLSLPSPEMDALVPRDAYALARVFPVLRRIEGFNLPRRRQNDVPDKQELRQRAFAALRELLARLGDRKPLVLHIDDLQWGDPDSGALLRDILRPPDPPVFLLIVCHRSEETAASPVLKAILPLESEGLVLADFPQIKLEPLSRGEAGQLAFALMGADNESKRSVSDAIADEAGGDPFLVGELVHYHQSRKASPGIAAAGQRIRLEDVLWLRAAGLPAAARRLLEAVVVAGHPMRQGDAISAAELTSEGPDAVRVLASSRMIRTTGSGPDDIIEPYHDRIREILGRRMSADTIQSWHQRLARAIRAVAKPDSSVLAMHLAAAGELEAAADNYASAAAQAADALAFDRAADFYQLSLKLRTTTPAEERELRAKLADALANDGRGPEASKEYLAAAEGAPASLALELRRRAAMQSLISGHIDEGMEALRTVLATVGMKLPRTHYQALRSVILRRIMIRLRGLRFRPKDVTQISPEQLTKIDVCWSAAVGLSIVDPLYAADFDERGLLLSLRSGEPYRIAKTLAIGAGHISADGRRVARRVEQLLGTARKLAAQTANPHAGGVVTMIAGLTAFLRGEWKQSLERSDEAERTLRDHCTGVTWELTTAQAFSTWSLFYLGELRELSRRLPVLLAESEKRGNLYALSNFGSFARPMAALAADSPDIAERDLQDVMRRWSHKGFHVQHAMGLYGQGLIDLYRDDGRIAWAHFNEKWPALKKSLLLRVQQIRTFIYHTRARCALAAAPTSPDREALIRIAAHEARRLEREDARWANAFAQLIRAGLAIAEDDIVQAATRLKDAIVRLTDVDMNLYAACARRRLGELLGGDEGRGLIAEANAWMAAQNIRDTDRMTMLHIPGRST
jgi:serine/threonine protein kinase